ncbi:MAG: 4a-hydroxytetrahydrobiopterin dehydratase [Candidatus Thermoplasmatota archaeon]|nr:4a-hydroxytetrahydrobiopterin dehydratase [Candidatus Thermoplasmatota archaeon]
MNPPANWAVVEGKLMREFTFDDFDGAKAFIDAVSSICDQLNHHADLHFGWGYAVVETFTHDAGALTDLDAQLADAINRLEA